MSSTDTVPANDAASDAADVAGVAATEESGAAAQAATDEIREAVLAELTAEMGEAVVGSHLAAGVDLTVRVTSDAWATAAVFLKEELGFAYFGFLSAIDWLPSPFGRDMDSQVDLTLEPSEPADPDLMEQGLAGGETRFQVLARVNDIVNHRAVTLKADVDEASMSVPSWVPVYAGANWHERETWEMFGINFVGHPGLRHIYLPGAFEGNPLRKDYPLLARRVKPWPGIVDVELMPTEEPDGADGADKADGADNRQGAEAAAAAAAETSDA
ncbi:MAG: NADH-quinone oxidoreductase subunit C [Acidimicrobiaceae bacterium]|nr:NADH-quinone oxidoreductase subunit C [Acidimicrobiaceae bacterium]